VSRPAIRRHAGVGARLDLRLQRLERLQRIAHPARLPRWRREIPTGNDRLGVGSRRGHGHEELAAIGRGSGDRHTPLASAIVTDAEGLVRRASGEGTLIGAALATANLPWMNAARRRVGDADREDRALAVSGRLHRCGAVHLHDAGERGGAHQRGAPAGIHVHVTTDFADRLAMKWVAGCGGNE